MINIARLISYFSGEAGGPVNHILELTQHLRKFPIKTTIYTSSDIDNSASKKTFPYQKLGSNIVIKRYDSYLRFRVYRVSPKLIISLLKDNKIYDILHSHT